MTRRVTPRQIASNYNLIAERFQRERSATIGLAFVDRFSDLLPLAALVLDIGCGTGLPIAKQLVERGCIVDALDLSEKMIALAKQKFPNAT